VSDSMRTARLVPAWAMRSMTVIGASDIAVRELPSPDPAIQILRVADCPLVGKVRRDVQECVDRAGLDVIVDEVEGPYPSPTVLVGGRDVTGRSRGAGPTCRLDLPSRAQISRAFEGVGSESPFHGSWLVVGSPRKGMPHFGTRRPSWAQSAGGGCLSANGHDLQ
jgi:hypothetical protein